MSGHRLSCGAAKEQIPDRMAELAAALFELRQRPMIGPRRIVEHRIDEQRLSIQHIEHLLRIILPVRGEMHVPVLTERASEQMHEGRLDQTAFMMALLWPGIR